jgi:hypothetical protein
VLRVLEQRGGAVSGGATSSANTSADLMTEARESKSVCDVLRPVVQREWHSANEESPPKKTRSVSRAALYGHSAARPPKNHGPASRRPRPSAESALVCASLQAALLPVDATHVAAVPSTPAWGITTKAGPAQSTPPRRSAPALAQRTGGNPLLSASPCMVCDMAHWQLGPVERAQRGPAGGVVRGTSPPFRGGGGGW